LYLNTRRYSQLTTTTREEESSVLSRAGDEISVTPDMAVVWWSRSWCCGTASTEALHSTM
jgi:hypothetical protein